jgi:tetratricopeptide (TPR) repeat protein
VGRRALTALVLLAGVPGLGACAKRTSRREAVDAGPAARTPAPSAPTAKTPLDIVTTPCPIAEPPDLNAALDESARRFDEKDYDVALACADLASRIHPESVEAHHNRAVALSALEQWEPAKQAFTLALAIDPDDPQTLAGAAHFYINRLGPERELILIGLEYARRGSSRAGRRRGQHELQSRLALLEAEALDDLGRSDEALSRVDAAVELDGKNDEGRFQRALILFHLCRLDRAKAAFTEVLARTPDDAEAHQHLGLILEMEGRQAEAQAHLDRARVLAPDRFPAPVVVSAEEFRRMIDAAVAALDPMTRAMVAQIAIEQPELPTLDDLTAVDPPFPPTILGLYRGAPLGEQSDEPRAILLYRKNLARAVTSRAELEEQVRITLWHEVGHLKGEDEDDLRARGLE